MPLIRIAMWSGPRNISTAMMRSWGNRADCLVIDEPFYAYYLSRTGLDHPGRDAILDNQPNDWPAVAAALTSGPVPTEISVTYQKHMTHHLLPEIDRSALDGLRHAFLIRDPAQMLLSYAKVRGERIFALDEHLARLQRSARALAFVEVPSVAELTDQVRRTLAANDMRDDVHIRLTLTRGVKITSGMDRGSTRAARR